MKFIQFFSKSKQFYYKSVTLFSVRHSSHLSNTNVNITDPKELNGVITVDRNDYIRDSFTNVTPHVLNYVGRNLHLQHNHPLNLFKRRLVNFIYGKYVNKRGNPLFSVYDSLPPVVTVEQNFDSLLIAPNHVSRKKTDTYYINQNYVLRTQTSAHQKELILSGLDNFLVIGDVYRRDEIDSTHYPVFHQAEGVRLFPSCELFHSVPNGDSFNVFEKGVRSPEKQECHSVEAVKMLERDLKDCLSSAVQYLFGSDTKHRWVDSYFPFTHPSWELEILWKGDWLEVLGCGIIEQEILKSAGAEDKLGWAFGLGLERLAMLLYSIPDIRIFWSKDSGFLSQFDVENPNTPIKYKSVSKYPQCTNDMSFWIPEDFHENDFYDVVRSVGGEIVEQVYKVDEFFHPKHKRKSFCFRIIYRHMERTLTQPEVNVIHNEIGRTATKLLNVEIRTK